MGLILLICIAWEDSVKSNDASCCCGLKHNLLDEETFEKELALCTQLNQDNNGGCNWGKCEFCGVIPLLYKLHKGRLFENPQEIQELRAKHFDSIEKS